jgi:sec-independent protein translocase protein TatC
MIQLNGKQLTSALGLPAENLQQETIELEAWIRPLDFAFKFAGQFSELTRPATLTALSVTEVFMVWMKVAVYLGFVIGSPWIFYHIWMFIAAGLYPHEKKLVHWYLPFSIILFLAGAALCQFVVLPIAIDYLLSFNRWLNIEPDLRLSEWLSFAILLPVMFGLSFQTPMLMFFLYKLNFTEVDTYQKYRKVAIFVLFVVAALLVTGDPISLFGLAVPLVLLYELGIIMCKMSPRQVFDLDVEESEEMVEV